MNLKCSNEQQSSAPAATQNSSRIKTEMIPDHTCQALIENIKKQDVANSKKANICELSLNLHLLQKWQYNGACINLDIKTKYFKTISTSIIAKTLLLHLFYFAPQPRHIR